MEYNTIHSLGSRCQNSLILKKNNLREFSGFFDFLNVEKVEWTIHMLDDEFKEFLKEDNLITFEFNNITFDPETDEKLLHSVRTANKFYQTENYSIPDYAICPHFNLKDTNERNHFFRCIDRLRKMKDYNVLFNYTYNSWENEVSEEQMNKMYSILKERYEFSKFKICFISLKNSNKQEIKKISESDLFDCWELNIMRGSYTGGVFSSPVDNENFINIINQYSLSKNRLTKKQIDI